MPFFVHFLPLCLTLPPAICADQPLGAHSGDLEMSKTFPALSLFAVWGRIRHKHHRLQSCGVGDPGELSFLADLPSQLGQEGANWGPFQWLNFSPRDCMSPHLWSQYLSKVSPFGRSRFWRADEDLIVVNRRGCGKFLDLDGGRLPSEPSV